VIVTLPVFRLFSKEAQVGVMAVVWGRGHRGLESVITRRSAEEMNLKPGDTVTAMVNADDCR